MKKFDFVYTFHFGEELKDEAIFRLNTSIKSLNLKKVKICLLNCSEFCIRDLIPFEIEYLHIPREGVYNKPFMINEAVNRMVTSEYFNLSDIDIVYPETFLETIKILIRKSDEPIRIVFHNHNMGQGNYHSYNECERAYELNKDHLRSKTGPAIGLGIIHTESFKRLGGFDERFIGYGPEDKEFNFRISRICKYIDLNDVSLNTYHLWHNNNTPKENYRTNMRIWFYIKNYLEKNDLHEVVSGSIQVPDMVYHQYNESIKEIEF